MSWFWRNLAEAMLLVMFSGISHRSRPGKYLVLLARGSREFQPVSGESLVSKIITREGRWKGRRKFRCQSGLTVFALDKQGVSS
jgi:hypothetical protein